MKEIGFSGTMSFETFNGLKTFDPALAPELLRLLNATGSNTLRFLPPLIVTETEIDKLIDALPGMIAAVRE